LDCEFTGLSNGSATIHPFDSTSEYYEKIRHSTRGFVVIQFGFTCFKIIDGKVKLKSYNVYVYPHHGTQTLLAQGSSLSFLASTGFDFNKLFAKGLSTLNCKDEEKLRQNLEERKQQRLAMLKESHMEMTSNEVKKPMTPVPEREMNMLAEARELIQTVVDGKSPKVSFNKNGFQRKLIYEMIDSEFSTRVSTRSENLENNRKSLIIEPKRSSEEDEKIELEKQKKEEENLLLKVGLRLILKEISASQKLIVGHNCLFDILFLYRQCFDDIPEDFNEFKKSISTNFHNIIDTKFMASSDNLKLELQSTILGDICRELLQKEIVKNEDFEFETIEHSYELNSTKEHEAGYDSFITGLSFLGFLKHLKITIDDKFSCKDCKPIQSYLGRFPLQRIQNTFLYLHGNEPTINKDNVFFIKFPSTWKVADIQNQFKNYGPIQIFWVDNVSAYVTLIQTEMSSCVVKTISKINGFEIQSYNDFKNSKVELKRKRSPEPLDTKSSEKKQPDVKRRKTNEGVFQVSNDW
jgi:poly(A)-specific ribonuclease